jgi:hypothetical protein
LTQEGRDERGATARVAPIGADLRKKEGKSKTSSRCEKVERENPNLNNFRRRNDVTHESS